MPASGISQADIARMASVGRAAVSNWRSRYADFPQPNGGTRHSPTFDSVAVEQWLASHLASDGTQAVLPPGNASASPPPLAEPLLKLLRRADTRQPGIWLLHEQVVDNGLATAPLIRRLAGNGQIERTRVTFGYGNRVLLRVPRVDDTLDTDDIERQANAVLVAVAHRVTIYPSRYTASNYSPTKITYRGVAYMGYLRTRMWNVTIAETQ